MVENHKQKIQTNELQEAYNRIEELQNEISNMKDADVSNTYLVTEKEQMIIDLEFQLEQKNIELVNLQEELATKEQENVVLQEKLANIANEAN